MIRRRLAALSAAAALVTAAGLLSACTQTDVVQGSAVSVAVSAPFTSANAETSYGRASVTNADVALLTSTGFGYPDRTGAIVADTSFGTVQRLSTNPLTVRYTVNVGVDWSDGAPIDASDLLLAWAADSGALNSPGFDDGPYVDSTTGRYTRPFPAGVVFFDGAIGAGLEKASRMPVVGADGRSLTVIYDAPISTWRTVLTPTVPAHVLARLALHTKRGDAAAGKAAVVDAIQKHRTGQLSELATAWDDDFALSATPKNRALLVSSGPYSIAKISATRVVLTVNRRYTGERRPSFETVSLRVSPDPLETAKLLAAGDVDIATPEPGAATEKALRAIPGIRVSTGTQARAEHLDLQFSGGKHSTFTDAKVRRAFLDVVPRAQILARDAAGSGARLLDSFVLRPGMPGYAQATAVNGSAAYRTPDVDAARTLLAQARAVNPEVCILYDPSNPRRVGEFQLIQQSAARAGFVVTDCSSPDWEGLLGVAGSYDAALFAWDTTRLGPTAQALVFRSGVALANFNHYADPASDALIAQLARTDDTAQQLALMTRLDTRVWAAAYGVPLYSYPTLTAVDRRVSGVTRSPLAASVFWDAWAWKPAVQPSVG